MTLYQVDIGYACAGIITDGGRITEAAPIFQWAVGKKWQEFFLWASKKPLVKIINCQEDDVCPRCGGTEMTIVNRSLSKDPLFADVECATCGEYVRTWNSV